MQICGDLPVRISSFIPGPGKGQRISESASRPKWTFPDVGEVNLQVSESLHKLDLPVRGVYIWV
jgi:hypothetical protein